MYDALGLNVQQVLRPVDLHGISCGKCVNCEGIYGFLPEEGMVFRPVEVLKNAWCSVFRFTETL